MEDKQIAEYYFTLKTQHGATKAETEVIKYLRFKEAVSVPEAMKRIKEIKKIYVLEK